MNQKVKKVRQSLAAVIMLVAVAGFTSCEKFGILPIPFGPAATLSFKDDIQPIFNANCITCHGGARQPVLSEGKSFNSLTTGGFIKSPYETSRLYLQMNNQHPTSSFSVSIDRLKIQAWVTHGAKNN
jgi:mono/diheme cytochrome c family protein